MDGCSAALGLVGGPIVREGLGMPGGWYARGGTRGELEGRGVGDFGSGLVCLHQGRILRRLG